MGLAITVGMLASVAGDDEGVAYYRRQFTALAGALEAAGVVGYDEPERVARGLQRPHVSSFPYSFLHYLRRAYARVKAGMEVTPVDAAGLAADDGLVEDEAMMFSSHLLCHSDAEGYYVPVDFSEPLFLEDPAVSGGGMIGSSQRLLGELREIAPALGIALAADGSLADDEAARLAEVDDGAPLFREHIVWLTLHEACRASVASGAAIVFN
ncbi:MAG: hypothetical protein KC420_17405 [Myxococcales bacterium]|nr:hypothetical protein [Myxococcales bacterium]MCB9568939.1 hypothetical protein [Myxococcales bacterium]MCB9700990.1 hypothetical protein [Myxococcales bacterium]